MTISRQRTSPNDSSAGDRVAVEEGVRAGDVYEYVGETADLYDYTTANGDTTLNKGDLVKVNADYDEARGIRNYIYRYLGNDG